MRRRRRGGSRRVLIVLFAVLVVGALTAFPASSFTSANVERGATVGVANDDSAVAELTTSDVIPKKKQEVLVSITNGFASEATITVEGPAGVTLYNDSDSDDIEHQVTIETVETGNEVVVEINANQEYISQTKYYTIFIEGDGFDAIIIREVEILNKNSGGGKDKKTFCEKKPNHKKCA